MLFVVEAIQINALLLAGFLQNMSRTDLGNEMTSKVCVFSVKCLTSKKGSFVSLSHAGRSVKRKAGNTLSRQGRFRHLIFLIVERA